jgi:hypothetical protein
MFSISLQRDGHLRHYSISATSSDGWEVLMEADRQITRHGVYRDWHRVERAQAVFVREVSELTEHGWQIIAGHT